MSVLKSTEKVFSIVIHPSVSSLSVFPYKKRESTVQCNTIGIFAMHRLNDVLHFDTSDKRPVNSHAHWIMIGNYSINYKHFIWFRTNVHTA